MNKNPFIFSRPVRGRDFFNRKEEIYTAIGFIRSLQSFSVIGERRIGKTSFLQQILLEEVLKAHGIDPRKYIIIYLNIGSLPVITKEIFIKAIIERIKEQTQIEAEPESVFEKLETYVGKLASNDKNLIIALDEFEITTSILNFHFSYWLRSIFERLNVMAITASRNTVAEITNDGMASPLFNIFGNLFLGLFTREETEMMISEMFLRGKEELDKEEISFLADLSGGNPYLVQLLGYHYYEERKKKGKIVYCEFENKMLYHLKDQFENYWNHLTKNEKDFLINPKSMNLPVEHILRRKGFLIKENGKLKVFSRLFEKFLNIKKEKMKKKHLTFTNYVSYIKRWKPSTKNVIEGVITGVIVGIVIIFLSLLIT